MTVLGLPVPPGFTLSTEVCRHFYTQSHTYPDSLESQVQNALSILEKQMNRQLGSEQRPLLLSVRSGARASMPGMMDTILNLGLNERTVLALAKESQDPRFSYDSYRRFVAMYANVVLGVHTGLFEAALDQLKQKRQVQLDTELNAHDLALLVRQFKEIIKMQGKEFPEDPYEQLWGAIRAVFQSWMNPRAVTYRKLQSIPHEWGTAVNVQAMVFGNMGPHCATGVAFTRDPSTGEKTFFGEFLLNAQGEDVVAGIRTPHPINRTSQHASLEKLPTLEEVMPEAYKQLVKIYQQLEKHYLDMQDIEFTIEQGKLYILQTRNAKRTAAAAIRVAVDMVQEKLISKKEALLRIRPEQLATLLHPCLDPVAQKQQLAVGLPASPGAATGQIVFDPDTAESWTKAGKKVILIRTETSPEDIHGMSVAEGILTSRGGMTSHAAVVARGMGKCCISGCQSLRVQEERKEATLGSTLLKEGDFITLDGSTGEILLGQVPTLTPTFNKSFQKLMTWVDEIRKMHVRANADTPEDAKLARAFGAEGIGLCRTEHMFFAPHRIDVVREMILSETTDARKKALAKMLPMQRADFKKIFREMKGLPVTIRLLDPPLHEFIPQRHEDLEELAEKMSISFEQIKKKTESLHEFNPMLGHRGCRLGVSFPEIYRTQVRAITEAACELMRDEDFHIIPEIMIPLVGHWRELKWVKDQCIDEISEVLKEFSSQGIKKLHYQLGTMIETPRAALTADQVALHADFFSFGTNDLTQMAFGLSRDDSTLFLKDYLDTKIYENDPFISLDQEGVGQLIQLAIQKAKKVRPQIKTGVCGEQGGDPTSIHYCHGLGLDYVSCSPYRVPIARLTLAQAELLRQNQVNSKTKRRLGKQVQKVSRRKSKKTRKS